MGQNGSGKSTIIKLINETLRPEDGQVIDRGESGYCDADHANGLQRAHCTGFFLPKQLAVKIWNQSQPRTRSQSAQGFDFRVTRCSRSNH
jgi:ABC-type cobalamin/Fe3+-siderophores transport system ATPase subunit